MESFRKSACESRADNIVRNDIVRHLRGDNYQYSGLLLGLRSLPGHLDYRIIAVLLWSQCLSGGLVWRGGM